MSSVIGMRRTIFRRGWDKVDSVTGAGGGRKESSTMDEETRRSIRQGDDKSKESMQTVKVEMVALRCTSYRMKSSSFLYPNNRQHIVRRR